jgi:selenium metabolism protein YedF
VNTVIIINSEIMGNGSEELGRQLMGSFLRKIWSFDKKPGRILFYNSGVKLMAEGSAVLDALSGLADAGVDLIACASCVRYYDLKNKMRIGRISDMTEIAAIATQDERVVTI